MGNFSSMILEELALMTGAKMINVDDKGELEQITMEDFGIKKKTINNK
jgi:hypothetical protein